MPKTLAIPPHFKDRFELIQKANDHGDLALMSCLCAITKEPRYVICAVNRREGEVEMVPLAHLTPNDNPYEAYIPPD